MATATQPATSGDPWLALFDRLDRQGDSRAWLQAIRRAGNAHFSELGFPTTDDEEWRFTNVAPIAKLTPEIAQETPDVSAASVAPLLYAGTATAVFINGRFSPGLSDVTGLGEGISFESIAAPSASGVELLQKHLARHARSDASAFVALNTAFIHDGALVSARAGAQGNRPLHLLFLSTAAKDGLSSHPRILIVAGRNSAFKVVETHASLGEKGAFSNIVTEAVIEDGANVEHVKVQRENEQSFHIATIQSTQGRASNFLTHSISLGAALARTNVHPVLNAEGCECTMNGLYLARGSQLVDHHTAIDHAKARCNSHEYYHGILDGKARGVFNGKIFVRPDAQKTDAKQTNRNLLLSNEANIQTKPQLEIFADDVKCTHGATIGQMQEEHLFYLRARGIGLDKARRMLIHAFASEILARVSIESVRAELDAAVFKWFGQ